jgi:hypothetical protein
VLASGGCGGAGTDAPAPSDTLAPVFISPANTVIPENTTVVSDVIATSATAGLVRYHLAGGVDQDHFQIDEHTGRLRFRKAPDFEQPEDSNGNNTYVVVVAASAGVTVTRQTVTVAVTDDPVSVSVAAGHSKTLTFTWAPLPEATRYALYARANADAAWVPVIADINDTQLEVTVPVHLTDWVNIRYVLAATNAQGVVYRSDPIGVASLMLDCIGYLNASDTAAFDQFGSSVALSADGTTLAVGAPNEDSAAAGTDGDRSDNSLSASGAVYVFARGVGSWSQQAYIKAHDPGEYHMFGSSVALSADGATLVVGAPGHPSVGAEAPNGETSNPLPQAGAVYVFSREHGRWQQQTMISAPTANKGDRFGEDTALSADGTTLAVAVAREDADSSDSAHAEAGAVHVFTSHNAQWMHQARLAAANGHAFDRFGSSIALSADGSTLAIAAAGEDAIARSAGGDPEDATPSGSGAVHVFGFDRGMWFAQAHITSIDSGARGAFANSLALSGNGQTLAVGAQWADHGPLGGEAAAADVISAAGVTYVYERVDGQWLQQAHLTASNRRPDDRFGATVALSANGATLAVGALWENSAALGVGGDQANTAARRSGAVYMFERDEGRWSQRSYIKAADTAESDWFGAAIALSGDSATLAVGSRWQSGTVYVY